MGIEKERDYPDTYVVPSNFIERGTFLGGMLKIRNAVEAGTAAIVTGVPVLYLPCSLTIKIIILCLTALPISILALVGISGDSLSSYALNVLRFFKKRRVMGTQTDTSKKTETRLNRIFNRAFQKKAPHTVNRKNEKSELSKPAKVHQTRKKATPESRHLNPVAEYFPVDKIENGIVYTKDHRYIKILEVCPINFLLRSTREQRNIIYSYISYLKVSPVKMQIKVLSKRADINQHLETLRREMAQETDEKCRVLQGDYEKLIRQIGTTLILLRFIRIC